MNDMKSKVQQFWDEFNHGNLEGQLALFTDDIVFTVSGTSPFSGSPRGKDAIREHFIRFGESLEPGAKMHVREMIQEGEVVVCLSAGTMRGKTGRDYNNKYAFVFRFRDGAICSVTEYLDTALIETALCGKTIA